MSEHLSLPSTTSEVSWLYKLTRPFVHWHLISFSCLTAAGLLSLLTPLVLRWLIDQVLPRHHLGLLVAAVGLIFLSYQGKAALTGVGSYLSFSAAERTGLRLRMVLLRHLDTLSAEYYDDTPLGQTTYPFKEPIEEICYFGSDLLPAIVRLVLTTCFTVATMFFLNSMLTFATLPLIPAFLLGRHYIRKHLVLEAEAVQRDQAASNTFLQEHLLYVTAIQLLGQQNQQEKRAFKLWARTTRSRLKLCRTAGWFMFFTSLAVVSATCAVIGYGGRATLTGRMSLGSLVAFYSLVTHLFDPLSGAADFYARAQKTFASARRVQNVLRLRPNVSSAIQPILMNQMHSAEIQFTAVKFGYRRQKNMLQVPNLRILPSEKIMIVGENGAGKSALVKLINRMYEVDSGSIQIGGQDIRNLQLSDLRKFVAYLPRDPVLFEGTLASNLQFVKRAASESELNEVIECTGLNLCVAMLPNGIHQKIGPDCRQLSGGERQRLAIARALLAQPPVLILDEATSCLDASSEISVLRNLRRYLPQSTLVVISHRPSTAAECSRVLVLAAGRIVGDMAGAAFLAELSIRSGCISTP